MTKVNFVGDNPGMGGAILNFLMVTHNESRQFIHSPTSGKKENKNFDPFKKNYPPTFRYPNLYHVTTNYIEYPCPYMLYVPSSLVLI